MITSVFIQVILVVIVIDLRWISGLRLAYSIQRLPTHQLHLIYYRFRLFQRIMILLSDVQSFSGLVVLTATLAQYSTISLYHFSIAWMLCVMITTSHIGTVFYILPDPAAGYKTSRIALTVLEWALLVAMSLSGLFLFREWGNKPNHCFITSHGSISKPGDVTGSFWKGPIYISAGYLWMFFTGTKFYHTLEKKLCRFYRRHRRRAILFFSDLFLGALGVTAHAICWSVIGVNSIVESLRDNASLLEGKETQWGFGQIMALGILPGLAFPIYQLWDGLSPPNLGLLSYADEGGSCRGK